MGRMKASGVGSDGSKTGTRTGTRTWICLDFTCFHGFMSGPLLQVLVEVC